MIDGTGLIQIAKIIVFTAVFFVWVVRYENIIREFKQYELPNWLRDFVGILKLSFVIMFFAKDPNIVLLGSAGLALLMIGAIATHIKIKNPFEKMVPACSLLIFSLFICIQTY